ncbi:hypothetical protein [Deinococcus sp. Leaf326]|uniref:hypothetical protein n=1 Tax=Deinococcus sp. Leaf326 TaxID=1736338 RepID=UPI0006F4D238|nr:hypothetical protein [Deinococcus sp. Leaf326]KQR37772.1 hypothetical protein ASF71_14925 [Deinococcus sp. Leaf326]
MKKSWLMLVLGLTGAYALPRMTLQAPDTLLRPERVRLGRQIRQTLKSRKARPPRVQGRRCC